jgi:signal transduction histidine kinase/ActR/RegA family two-component response regulator
MAGPTSVQRVPLHDLIQAEQARYIHRTVPTAALGSMVVAALVAVVFHSVVSARSLYLWESAMAVLTAVRMIGWWRYRGSDFSVHGRVWLRQATLAAFVGGMVWGAGSLFLFPPGLLLYQFTFMITLVMMSVAAMFSYAPHYATYFAYILPSMLPGIVGLEVQGGIQQQAMGAGLLLLLVVVLLSVRFFNRMFLESMRLRFENIDLVTQLTVQKDAAEAANLAKSRFLAAASHDLRQPIHALNLYLGAFAQLELPRRADALFGKIRQCAQIMDEMFRTLLDISKLDAGAIRPQLSVFALAPLLARARVEFEPQARARGIELRIRNCSGYVRSDAALVERILRNLISNAIRYTERGGVVVGCRPRGAGLRLCVYDTGLGIEPREQSLVFEEFYQIGNRERDRSKGLGLGLAIVERLARLLRAPITLRSQPGKGSLFAFDLESAAAPDVPVVVPARKIANRSSLAGLLVVVVDDEELILDAAQTLLTQWDCTVIAATSGASALQKLAASPRAPDVLICDYRLRDDETGIAVVDAIRDEFNADIPALLLTGDTDPNQIRKISASGLAVLHKPLSEEELSEAMRALCAPHAVTESRVTEG